VIWRESGGSGDCTILFLHGLGATAAVWTGVRVRAVLGIGPKIAWPEADLEAARDLAARPVRCYATEDEALARYRRVSGLGEELAPGRAALARGVLHTPGGWRLAQDPGTFAVAGAPFTSLASAAQARMILARGERDPMVSFEELRAHARPAYDIRGAGHNAHVEDPRAVLGLIEVLLRAD